MCCKEMKRSIFFYKTRLRIESGHSVGPNNGPQYRGTVVRDRETMIPPPPSSYGSAGHTAVAARGSCRGGRLPPRWRRAPPYWAGRCCATGPAMAGFVGRWPGAVGPWGSRTWSGPLSVLGAAMVDSLLDSASHGPAGRWVLLYPTR